MNIDPNKLKQFLNKLPKKQFGGIQNPLSYEGLNNMIKNMPSSQVGAYKPLYLSSQIQNPQSYEELNNRLNNMQSTQVGVYKPLNLPTQASNIPSEEDFNLWDNAFAKKYPNNGEPTAETITPTQATTATQPAVANNTSLSDEDYQTWKMLDEKAKAGQQKPTENLNLINPYGGTSIEAGLAYGLFNAGQGNVGQASLGIGKGLFGLARTGLNAYSAGKDYKRGLQSQNNNSVINYTALEKGGEVGEEEYYTNLLRGKKIKSYKLNNKGNYEIELE